MTGVQNISIIWISNWAIQYVPKAEFFYFFLKKKQLWFNNPFATDVFKLAAQVCLI